ncbi:hypothetical protein ACFFMS_20255 [Ectobacillus funiculus]|uniref:Uncharacterized protein n=1 Tax=Ectobacillus funiculus TaxID=137993 RepID=A0ABV5WJ36_9BACI
MIRLPEKELKADYEGHMLKVYIQPYNLNLLPQKALTTMAEQTE